jgi:hypothetical protein
MLEVRSLEFAGLIYKELDIDNKALEGDEDMANQSRNIVDYLFAANALGGIKKMLWFFICPL